MMSSSEELVLVHIHASPLDGGWVIQSLSKCHSRHFDANQIGRSELILGDSNSAVTILPSKRIKTMAYAHRFTKPNLQINHTFALFDFPKMGPIE